MMTMTMEPKEGMMIIMNSNELWQNGFYVDGDDGSAADNLVPRAFPLKNGCPTHFLREKPWGRGCAADYDNRDLTKLRLRRQRERQKNNRFN